MPNKGRMTRVEVRSFLFSISKQAIANDVRQMADIIESSETGDELDENVEDLRHYLAVLLKKEK